MTLRQKLISRLETKDIYNTSIFGGITADNTWNQEGGCHGGLRYGSSKTEKIISLLQSHSQTADEHKYPYLHWLLNNSPWASAFVSHSEHYAVNHGLVTCSGHTPSNLLVGALQCSRRLWESKHVPIVWTTLVNNGFNHNLAFFLACSMRVYTQSPQRFDLGGWISDHNPLFTNRMTKETAENFIHNRPQNMEPDFYDEVDYAGVVDTWGTTVQKHKSFFPNYIKEKIDLPFRRKIEDWGEASREIRCGTIEEVLEQLIPLRDTLHEEFKCAE